MKKVLFFLSVLFFYSTMLYAEIIPGEWIVKFNSKMSRDSFEYSFNYEDSLNNKPVKKIRIAEDFMLLKGDIKGKIQNQFYFDLSIEYIQPNFKYRTTSNPTNDPMYNKLWAHERINVQDAWEYTTGSSEVIVAVIDSGIDYNHEDLRDVIWKNEDEIPDNGIDDDGNGYVDDTIGWDFNQNDNDPMDEKGNILSGNPGHGTHCAGTIGAVGNNGIGMTGVAQNVTIMALRFTGTDNYGSTAWAIKAIHYAIDNGAHMINASWGTSTPWLGDWKEHDLALQDAIHDCEENDILFIAAAGNHSANNDRSLFATYPASYNHDNIISVAASNKRDSLAFFSCYGLKTVDIAAPGTSIFSTVPGSKYQSASIPILASWDGTSMSAPFVTGVAALLKSYNSRLTYKEIKDILLLTVDKVPALRKKSVSGGRLNARAALKYLDENY